VGRIARLLVTTSRKRRTTSGTIAHAAYGEAGHTEQADVYLTAGTDQDGDYGYDPRRAAIADPSPRSGFACAQPPAG
jgi:hypothetical protein